MYNNTPIAIPFLLTFESDGKNPAMTCEEYFQYEKLPNITDPKEYSCDVDRGSVPSNSCVTLTVST